MGASAFAACALVALLHQGTTGFLIRNKLLGRCLAGSPAGGRVSTGECSPDSPSQEWNWLPDGRALRNQPSGECLTAPREQYEGARLQPCPLGPEEAVGEEKGVGDGGETATEREHGKQAWSCSKRGHLTLLGQGLHLIATKDSTLVFLSKEHKQQGSRWWTLDNQTVCSERDTGHHLHLHHHHLHLGKSLGPVVLPNALPDIHKLPQQSGDATNHDPHQGDSVTEMFPSSVGTKSPSDPTMVFFSMDYGMGWKITMLVLSSLALVLGTLILILNVYSNRRKKVVCVLRSYAPREAASVPGSPVPNERAALTKHAMRLPRSSPSLRGEILIEWKDGTVTPLYEG